MARSCRHTSATRAGDAYVSIRQHPSAYVRSAYVRSAYVRSAHASACVSIRQHTSAYVSIRQHTSACMRFVAHLKLDSERVIRHTSATYDVIRTTSYVRRHTSQTTSYVRRHTSATYDVIRLPFALAECVCALERGGEMYSSADARYQLKASYTRSLRPHTLRTLDISLRPHALGA